MRRTRLSAMEEEAEEDMRPDPPFESTIVWNENKRKRGRPSHGLEWEGHDRCFVVSASADPGFRYCACVVRHPSCRLYRTDGRILCSGCRARHYNEGCAVEMRGELSEREFGEMIIFKYRSHAESVAVPLSFDPKGGTPLVDEAHLPPYVPQIDRRDLLNGLRYCPGFISKQQGEELLEYTLKIVHFMRQFRRLSNWADHGGKGSEKLFVFSDQSERDLLRDTYDHLVTVRQTKSGEKADAETAWTEWPVIPPELTFGFLGQLLPTLFGIPKTVYRSAGCSINFQHHRFPFHTDEFINGGFGDSIATITMVVGGVVYLFSIRSCIMYTFPVEVLSCWGMRSNIMEQDWMHSVKADEYPEKAANHALPCSCRKSFNFRGISEHHLQAMRKRSKED